MEENKRYHEKMEKIICRKEMKEKKKMEKIVGKKDSKKKMKKKEEKKSRIKWRRS